MQDRRNSVVASERLLFSRWRVFAAASGGARLLCAAAVLHVLLAVGLFTAGRAHVAPGLIDRDGIIGSFAFDSYEYQHEAARLVEILRQGGLVAWATERAPLHVKAISIQFAILGPLFGYGTLSAEPFNLICYVVILGVALVLGREVGGERAGLLAAGVIAVWPTFFLHTMQLLKDPFFIACALVLVLCMTFWLTRTLGPRGFLVTAAVTAVALSLVLIVRSTFAIFILALVLIGFTLLVIRELRERRPLYWNMICPLLILVVGVLLLLVHSTSGQKTKHPSDQSGQPKAVAGEGVQVPTIVTYLPRPQFEDGAPTYANRFYASASRVALKLSSVRERFEEVYSQSGSNIDAGVRFSDLKSVLLYLPRAFKIGCWAPFPTTWATPGKQVGSAGRLLAGAETLTMYLFELLALVAVLRPARRLASWLLLSISAFGVTLLALVVPNVGALYRFRYTFWVLLIILGAKGFEALLASWRLKPGLGGVLSLFDGGPIKRIAIGLGLVCVFATAFSRSPQADPIAKHVYSGLPDQGTFPSATKMIARPGLAPLGLDLVNLTPSTIRAVYISPSDSSGWEENVLGSSQLGASGTVGINFDAQEKAALWDVKVESVGKLYAEWKGLDLRGVSRITLLLSMVGKPVAVAEVE